MMQRTKKKKKHQVIILVLVSGSSTKWDTDHAMLFLLPTLCAHCSLRVVFIFVADSGGTSCGFLRLQPFLIKVGRVVCPEMLFCSPQLQRVVILALNCSLSVNSDQSGRPVFQISQQFNKEFPLAELPLGGCFQGFFFFVPFCAD